MHTRGYTSAKPNLGRRFRPSIQWLKLYKEKQADELRRAELGKRLAQLQADVNAASLVSMKNKKLWNDELDENLLNIGLAPLEDNPCI